MSKQTDLINVTDAITVSGSNVGIGTSSPSTPVSVHSALPSGGAIAEFRSTGNVSSTLDIRADGTGDSRIWFDLNGATPFAIGVDNSDGDKFKISGSSQLGTNDRLTIDSSGRVGIGTSSPANLLNLYQSDTSSNSYLHVNHVDSGTGASNGLSIGLESNGTDAAFRNRENGSVKVYTNNAERMRIDNSGNLLVGTTDSNVANNSGSGNDGVSIQPDSVRIARTDGDMLLLNRLNSDGDIAKFLKDGSTVGSVGVNNSDNLYIQGNSSHAGIQFGTNSAMPHTNGNTSDNAEDLGTSNTRWKDLYLSGGVYLGGTGSANKLEDYEEGTWTPSFPNGGTIGTFNSATYTKVGQLVFAGFYISTLSGIPNNSTAFLVGGLPFNVTSGSGYQAGGGISYVNGANWASTGGLNTPLAQVNTANFYFHRDDGNANTVQSAQASVLNGQEMICSIIYQTSA